MDRNDKMDGLVGGYEHSPGPKLVNFRRLPLFIYIKLVLSLSLWFIVNRQNTTTLAPTPLPSHRPFTFSCQENRHTINDSEIWVKFEQSSSALWSRPTFGLRTFWPSTWLLRWSAGRVEPARTRTWWSRCSWGRRTDRKGLRLVVPHREQGRRSRLRCRSGSRGWAGTCQRRSPRSRTRWISTRHVTRHLPPRPRQRSSAVGRSCGVASCGTSRSYTPVASSRRS